jgi:hypothetical protein
MNAIIGAVFPISSKHASRIFDEGRTVFAKYTKMTKINKKSKIIFYVSKEKTLIGEGVVKSVTKMTPSDAWSQYGANFFLNEEEYKRYTSWSAIEGRNRTTAEITVFVLECIRKYKQSLHFRTITPSGCYLTAEDYNKLKS